MALAGRVSCHLCFKGKWMRILDGSDSLGEGEGGKSIPDEDGGVGESYEGNRQ